MLAKLSKTFKYINYTKKLCIVERKKKGENASKKKVELLSSNPQHPLPLSVYFV
jgi:phage anti-repressor protein